jgi:hypothetical protein
MITIGQTYTTKSGMIVTIEHDKGDHYYPFFGKIMQANGLVHRIAYYTYGGKYIRGADSENDLII